MTADTTVVEGFVPGAIGSIVTLHARYYARHWGFGLVFEAKVARELAAFAQRVSDRDLVLLARRGDAVVGSLILDLNDPDSGPRGAHLRWFILDPDCAGGGIGRQMMTRAMAHLGRLGDGRAWLTTFAGLDTARALYERHGFALVHEAAGDAWGTVVTEQEFARPRQPVARAPS